LTGIRIAQVRLAWPRPLQWPQCRGFRDAVLAPALEGILITTFCIGWPWQGLDNFTTCHIDNFVSLTHLSPWERFDSLSQSTFSTKFISL
jgi:hypothetical protein